MGTITNAITCVMSIVIIALIIWAIVALCQWGANEKRNKPVQTHYVGPPANNHSGDHHGHHGHHGHQDGGHRGNGGQQGEYPARQANGDIMFDRQQLQASGAAKTLKNIVRCNTDEEADAAIKKHGDSGMMLMFYATWCPHCTTFKPEFEQAAKDCDDADVTFCLVEGSNARKVLQDFEIRGFPTCVFHHAKKHQKEHYKGGRNKDGILQFVKKMMQ